MRDYKTPGVYVEEMSVLPGSVAGVTTAVPAFIGYTEKAGVNGDLYYKPTRITTFKEYESLFGPGPDETITVDTTTTPYKVSISAKKLMYYSMQMFFNNGGEGCYIVAINSADTKTPDKEKTQFAVAIDALELEDEPTLIVLVDGVNMAGDTPANYYDACQKVLRQCNKLKDRFAIFDVIETSGGTTETTGTMADAKAFRDGVSLDKDYLKYGAAYYPYLKSTLNYKYSDASVKVTIAGETTAKPLSDIGNHTQLYSDIITAIQKSNVILPPSAAIAGAYASVDRDRGVWKAPANVGLTSVIAPDKKITETENDYLNIDADTGKSINAVRNFTGKGTLIWGARTLAGNDNEWRYVSVRRLFNYIEESVQKATSFAVFEPNNAMTWLKIRSMVESFLDNLWRMGALVGGKAEDAYFVQAGLGTTMTSQDILEGKLIIKVGLAAVRPAEFITLEFTHKLQQS